MNNLPYIEIHTKPVPEQFSKKIFDKLSPKFRQLLPIDRRVLVGLKDYDIKHINPHFSNTDYERIIIVCIKFLRDDSFQPIGSILIPNENNLSENSYYILGEAIKMYIFTVHLMGLFVKGTISPPTALYKKIYMRILNMDSFESFNGPIKFDVHPFKDLIHLFDYFTIISNIMNDFKKYKIIWYELDGNDFEETNWLELWPIFKRNRELSNSYSKYAQDHYMNHFFTDNILSILYTNNLNITKTTRSNIRFMEIFTCFMRLFDLGMIVFSIFLKTQQSLKVLLTVIGTMRFKSTKYQKYINLDDFNDWIIHINGILVLFDKLYLRDSDMISAYSLKLDYLDEFVNYVRATKNQTETSPSSHEIELFDTETAFLALNNTPDGGCFMIIE